ncbi:7TM protein involved in diverse intracellular signaling [Kordia periserrulae]|uniref:7TM protein involved in diverse intracellular signaling n=1 Tax=Kordia periserrulae TaxID=701523 RepID=A0A2T6C5A9_9FLAO|nr:7TM diverse intracellular signaling domain-containing protein [Kordia periserrulae]PTX63514.1 7TM protein involved in diverse intracellular signaling [Kordia periserrulae]
MIAFHNLLRIRSAWMVISCVFLCLQCSCVSSGEKEYVIENGVLDISAWNTNTEAIALQGAALFYWKQWAKDENGNFDASLLKKADTINASTFLWSHIRNEKRGYGTLRFAIQQKRPQKLVLEIPRLLGAAEVWINGKLVKSHGQISKNAAEEKIDGRPLEIILPQEPFLDMVFLISNHKHRLGGGIALASKIKTKEYYQETKLSKPLIEGIITFLILLFGMYQIIHFFSFPTYKYYLYLGLFCLIGASRQLFVGENLIYSFYPEISFDWVQKMRYIGYYGGLLSVFMYHAVLFPGYFHKYLIVAIKIITSIGILYVIVVPTYYTTLSAPIFQVLGLFYVFLGFYQILMAIKDKRPYAIGMFISMSITAFLLANDLLIAMLFLKTEFLVIYGLLFYVGFQIVLNNRIQKQTEKKLAALAFDIQNMSKNIQQKQEEIVQLRSETFQQLKSKEKLVENLKKVASKDESISIQNLIVNLKSELLEDSQLNRIKNDIETLNHEFAERLLLKHSNLTKTDIEICSYIRLSLSRKEIAKLRFTTVEAVKKSRSRLRKKMNLSPEKNLDEYIKSI